MYRVLKPTYERTGDVTITPDGEVKWCRLKEWEELGTARDMQEALQKFPRCKKNGYSPVLEPVRVH